MCDPSTTAPPTSVFLRAPDARRDAAGCTGDAMFIADLGAHSYGPPPMVQGARRRSVPRHSARQIGALAVVVGCAMLAACSGPAVGTAPGRVRFNGSRAEPSADASPSSPTDQASESPVISAWIAAQRAFEDSVRTADATAPELSATTVTPQLSWAESFVTLVRMAGEVARGPVAFGDPQVVRQGPRLATVRACVHDDEIVVSATTGHPVTGVLGQVDVELFTSIMERTASGWKLANQSVEVGQCSAT